MLTSAPSPMALLAATLQAAVRRSGLAAQFAQKLLKEIEKEREQERLRKEEEERQRLAEEERARAAMLAQEKHKIEAQADELCEETLQVRDALVG